MSIPFDDLDWINVNEDRLFLEDFLLKSGGNHSFSWKISWISYSESSELEASLELELEEFEEEDDDVNEAGNVEGSGLLS